MAELEDYPGKIVWHSSEEDGMPDVGVSLTLDSGVELWCGDISRNLWENSGPEIAELGNDGGSWLVVWGPGEGVTVVGKVEHHSGRALLEYVLAPLIRDRALTPAPVADFWQAVIKAGPNGDIVQVRAHPNGDWSVYDRKALTPAPADVVEVVARALMPYLPAYHGSNPDVDDQHRGHEHAKDAARAAISALTLEQMADDAEREARVAVWNELRRQGVDQDLCYPIINGVIRALKSTTTIRALQPTSARTLTEEGNQK